MTGLERLESLLDEKDRRIEVLEERVRALTDESERVWDWARHQLLEDGSALPVPRLEIRCRIWATGTTGSGGTGSCTGIYPKLSYLFRSVIQRSEAMGGRRFAATVVSGSRFGTARTSITT